MKFEKTFECDQTSKMLFGMAGTVGFTSDIPDDPWKAIVKLDGPRQEIYDLIRGTVGRRVKVKIEVEVLSESWRLMRNWRGHGPPPSEVSVLQCGQEKAQKICADLNNSDPTFRYFLSN